jgi:hypothetical protein
MRLESLFTPATADGADATGRRLPVRFWDLLLGLAVLWGVGLRLAEWWSNRSLWVDEFFLIESIISRDFAGLLTKPLNRSQGAPGGFLVLAEGLTRLFGTGERVVRIPALMAGLAALPCFALLSRRWLSRGGAVVCTLLFAQAEMLVYWSADFKPYSFDVLALVLLALLASAGLGEEEGRLRRRGVLLAVAGGLAP